MLKAAASSAETVRIVCDDTDVFVLLVYWTWRKTIRKNIQMEKWDGTVLDIIIMAVMAVFLRGWLPHRGKAQMACNYCFPTRTMF